jgi:transposase-like protein
MNKERRKFTKEYKEQAVRLLEESGRVAREIARKLEVAVEYFVRLSFFGDRIDRLRNETSGHTSVIRR